MFTEIAPIVANGTILVFTIAAAEDGEMRLTLQPKHKEGANPALSTHLELTASPAVLDEQLGALLQTKYVAPRLTLEQQLENSRTIMEAAGKKAVSAATKAAASPKTAADDGADLEGEGEEEDGVEAKAPVTPKARPSVAKTFTAKPPKADTDLQLF